MHANVVTDHDLFEVGGPGTVQFTGDGKGGTSALLIKCPGCGEASALPLMTEPNPHSHPQWSWDGNREFPTLSPSIHHQQGCGWHGHLRNGVFA